MRTKRNQPRAGKPRLRKCKSCEQMVAAGSLVGGQCPDCAGLVALPLRGEGGRFIKFTTGSQGGERR